MGQAGAVTFRGEKLRDIPDSQIAVVTRGPQRGYLYALL